MTIFNFNNFMHLQGQLRGRQRIVTYQSHPDDTAEAAHCPRAEMAANDNGRAVRGRFSQITRTRSDVEVQTPPTAGVSTGHGVRWRTRVRGVGLVSAHTWHPRTITAIPSALGEPALTCASVAGITAADV